MRRHRRIIRELKMIRVRKRWYRALGYMSSGMNAFITPPERRWFRISEGSEVRITKDDVKNLVPPPPCSEGCQCYGCIEVRYLK